MRDFINIVESEETPATQFIAAMDAIVAKDFSAHIELDLEIPWETRRPDVVEIAHIGAKVQRQGWGTRTMTAVCGLADKMNITLVLGVANETDGDWNDDEDEEDEDEDEVVDRDPSESELINFYSGFGFEVRDDVLSDRILMKRVPG